MTTEAVPVPDRRLWLLGRDATLNGVDFAAARRGHRGQIDVHFINRVPVRGALAEDRPPITLAAGSGRPDLFVRPVDEDADWSTDTYGRPVLHITADVPGSQPRCVLTVHSRLLDPCFRSAVITFRGPGDGDTDCATTPLPRPLPGAPTVPIDYLAKDFASFSQALSNFSAARYTAWTERSEADFGVMLMEVLSALADELSYQQDRVAAEATLDTATQRLSLLRHARLIDYEPAPATAATTIVQFDVARRVPGDKEPLPDAIQCQAIGGQSGAVDFAASPGYALDPRWNRYADQAGTVPQLVPHLWDADMTCLPRGATSMWIGGHDHGFYPGQELLIDTAGGADGDPPNREIVQVTGAKQDRDLIQGKNVTLIRWADGLASDHDLLRTRVAGNLVPAAQGRITNEVFVIPGDAQPPGGTSGLAGPPAPLATVRADHSDSPAHCLYSLTGPLAWRLWPAPDGGRAQARPVLTVRALAADLPGSAAGGPSPPSGDETVAWQWVPRLLDADSTAEVFTVTPERYSPVLLADDPSFYDYDGDGATIRFGDGTFGRPAVPGTTFRVRYLSGGGNVGNVAPDTIVTVAPGDPAISLVWRCTNPFAASGGADAETPAQIRDRAPQQIKAGLLTLTGPADYQAAALSFSPSGTDGPGWARQAIAAVRWTGSWFSTLTIADPAVDERLGTQLAGLAGLADLLNARRLTGADTAVALARYRWLDLRITCQAERGYRPSEVETAVLAQLDPRPGANGRTGFFGRDRWTFGQPLEASALITAIQSCPGVAGVSRIEYRGTRAAAWRPLRAFVGVPAGEILRIGNNRDRPEHGLLFVTAEVAR